MKKLTIALLAAASSLAATAAGGIEIMKADGETLSIANSEIATMSFDGANAVFTSVSGKALEVLRTDILSIAPTAEVATEYSVKFDGDKVSVINPYAFSDVTTEIDGGYVTTTNGCEGTELTFTLSGATADGGYLYNGTYKCTLKLNGVDITSQRGAAIDIKCGKRIVVVLVDGTMNTLADYAEGSQKAALYFKGHPEFEKGGTLNVTGNAAHAISAKEYVQIKKTVGAINILSSANDGIHAGQYFQMNGGKVTIANVLGDGIQTEVTDDDTDEQNGQMIIKGGTLDITVSGPTADCLKADSLITISGGTLNLKATGDGIQDNAAGIRHRAPGGGRPGGGWPGGGGGSKVETSSPKCINGGWDITITGGQITTLSTGKGGKGIVCDGILTIGGDGLTPEISCSTTGSAIAGSGDNLSGLPKAMKAEGDININSGTIICTTSQNGGEGIETKARLTVNGGIVICNTCDDGINAAKKVTFNGGVVWSWATGNDGIDCNGTEGIEINGGIIVTNGARSPEEGFDCDNYPFVINGGTALGIGGATSNVTRATQPYAQTTGVNVTQGRYVSILDPDGNVLLSYLSPVTLSSATVVSTSPGYRNNTACKLVYGATSVTDPAETHLDGRILVGGTLTGGTTKSITPRTK